MPHTTRPPVVDITAAIPGLAAYARTAIRLHPRRGTPKMADSHIGGPLLWPSADPWPRCLQGHDVAMTPVAQLFVSDLLGYPFPADYDLVQFLWCPAHEAHFQAEMHTRWRRTADVTDVLFDPPKCHRAEDEMVPFPCVLDPEPVTEYPWEEDLPRKIRNAIRAWEKGYPAYQYGLSIASGCKVGGGMSWEVTDMNVPPTCPECGARSHPFLQLDSTEWGGESDHEGGDPRWRPIEDAALLYRFEKEAREPTGLGIGRHSHGSFHLCSADPDHAMSFHVQ
ncbi:hypothetical protein [Spirillospora sp. NPDC047279]|uniref:hypothetical protein n=1 Tax=Spirillospora sp. NPDC047279 TaxID=3155478 RepID=UPI0033D2526C